MWELRKRNNFEAGEGFLSLGTSGVLFVVTPLTSPTRKAPPKRFATPCQADGTR